MYLLGIDPGYHRIGYSVLQIKQNLSQSINPKPTVVAYGIITTETKLNFEKRLLQIETELLQLLETFTISYCGIEEVFIRKYITTAYSLLQARGVILCSLAKKNISIFNFNPKTIKKMITHDGKASKSHVQAMIKKVLGLSEIPKPDDAADALSIAVATWLQVRSQKSIS